MLSLATAVLILLVWWLVGFLYLGADLFLSRWRAGGGRILLLAASVPLSATGIVAADYIHLFVLSPYYLYRIDQTQERPVRFPWGDAAVTVLDGYHFRNLLYDDSGATQAGGDYRRDTEGGNLWIGTRHLLGNFYVQEVSNW